MAIQLESSISTIWGDQNGHERLETKRKRHGEEQTPKKRKRHTRTHKYTHTDRVTERGVQQLDCKVKI